MLTLMVWCTLYALFFLFRVNPMPLVRAFRSLKKPSLGYEDFMIMLCVMKLLLLSNRFTDIKVSKAFSPHSELYLWRFIYLFIFWKRLFRMLLTLKKKKGKSKTKSKTSHHPHRVSCIILLILLQRDSVVLYLPISRLPGGICGMEMEV